MSNGPEIDTKNSTTKQHKVNLQQTVCSQLNLSPVRKKNYMDNIRASVTNSTSGLKVRPNFTILSLLLTFLLSLCPAPAHALATAVYANEHILR